jgi:hypothetical protein
VFVNAKVRAELFHYLFREATGNNCEAFVFDPLREVMEHRYQIIATASLTKTGVCVQNPSHETARTLDERNGDCLPTHGSCTYSMSIGPTLASFLKTRAFEE